MKMAKRVLWLGLAIAAFTATSANAVLISIDPLTQNATIGDTVSANIVVSDLMASESVGGVSLLLSFNAAILQGASYILDPNNVMGAPLDLFDLSFGFSGAGGSPLDLFFLADFLFDHTDLKALQGTNFVAATVNFLAVGNGLSPLNLSVVEPGGAFLSAADGVTALVTQAVNGSVCVGGCDVVVPVPEPGALSLLGAGLLGILAARRRRQGIQPA